MTTEVTTKETFKPPLVTGGRIKAIVPENIEQAYRLANAIAAANMAPKAYNRDANSIMVGILHGMEVGLPPMAALQSIAVINGMPAIWGDGALGLVRASGLLEEFKETTEGEGDQAKATCWVKRKGEEGLERSFSVADAEKAALLNKDIWKKYRQRMLQMRARSWALRDGFADVLRGLHIAEEAQDMGNLYQAADGAYVPAEHPQRADYVKQAEARQQAAEPDLDAEHRRVTTGYVADEPEDEETTESPSEDAPGDERVFIVDGHALLYDGAGQEIGRYKTGGRFFSALKAQIPEEVEKNRDPITLIEDNEQAANHFVTQDELWMDTIRKCQDAAREAQGAQDSLV